jgi:hypothetical protein
MPTTYEPIANTTLGSAVASYTFSSIPNTYTDLVLVCSNLVENTNQQGFIRFNSDGANNYSRTVLYGNGSSAASFRQTNQSGVVVGMSSNTGGQYIKLDILNYSNTATYKSAVDREGNADGATIAGVFLWRSTSAINSITIASFDGSSSIQSGATFSLYGIKGA